MSLLSSFSTHQRIRNYSAQVEYVYYSVDFLGNHNIVTWSLAQIATLLNQAPIYYTTSEIFKVNLNYTFVQTELT